MAYNTWPTGHSRGPQEGPREAGGPRRDDAPNDGSANLHTSGLAGLDVGVGGPAGESVGRRGEDSPRTVCLRVGLPDGAASHLGVLARRPPLERSLGRLKPRSNREGLPAQDPSAGEAQGDRPQPPYAARPTELRPFPERLRNGNRRPSVSLVSGPAQPARRHPDRRRPRRLAAL